MGVGGQVEEDFEHSIKPCHSITCNRDFVIIDLGHPQLQARLARKEVLRRRCKKILLRQFVKKMMTNFPFEDLDELDFGKPALPFIKTEVNSTPLDCSLYIAPYVPSTDSISRQAIAFAGLGDNDILIDLGCGDGILFKYANCPSIGVELDLELYKYCIENYPHVKMLNCDLFTVDLVDLRVTVAVLYLLPAGLKRLQTTLKNWLETNRSFRVVTIFYQI